MISYSEESNRIDPAGELDTLEVMSLALVATCPEGAATTLARVKQVLRPVVEAKAEGGDWPDVEEWARRLPSWFVGTCAPELSAEEATRWLERWRALPREQQAEEEERQPWTLPDWLYWFEEGDDERQWRWLNGTVVDPVHLRIRLEVEGLPTAYGALAWLLRAAGAAKIEEA